MDTESLISQSLAQQVRVAANDSLGLCVFGQSVTNTNVQFLADTLNAAHGTSLTTDFFEALGRETLKLEAEFNRQAGFTEKDDELPAFFYSEPVPPTNHVARFHGADVHGMYERLPA
jgi:aldehyde:ferredoxin oxidoreductase